MLRPSGCGSWSANPAGGSTPARFTEHRIEWHDDLAVVHDEANGVFNIRTMRAEPPRYVSFRLELDAEGAAAPQTLVEFFVTDRSGGVTLRVVESGFAGLDLPAEQRRARFDGNCEGWEIELASARNHLEQ